MPDIDLSQAAILGWFASYASEPLLVYMAITGLMILSSFGLPIPEEVVLISAGLVAHLATQPAFFSGPAESAVSPFVTAAVAFFSVFMSDVVVFSLGRALGPKILTNPYVRRVMKERHQAKVKKWTTKYGMWAAGAFRFTPGLRFPGHMMCGIVGIERWKFMLVDGLAALVSVPTQVLLIAFYGDVILVFLKQFKISLLVIIVVVVAVFYLRKFIEIRKTPNS